MVRTIKCEVTNEYVKGSGVVSGATLSHDDVNLELHFSPFWDTLTKKVMFTDAYGLTKTAILLTADMTTDGVTYTVPIPYEAKRYPGEVTMSIKGATTHIATVNKTGDGTTKTFTLTIPGIQSITINGTATTAWTYSNKVLTFTSAPANNAAIVITSTPIEDRASLAIACTFEVKESAWDDSAESAQAVTADQATYLQSEIDTIMTDILYIRGHKTDAEAWAVGQREGVDVTSTDPTYHNNAKYYAEEAEDSADDALGYATSASGYATQAGNFADDAEDFKDLASASATSAATSASTAQSYTNNPPKPNNDDTWDLWDGTQYVASEYPTRGEKGDQGNQGTAAGFGTPTATVDGNTGIPSVTITATGSDTAKVFHFDFKNLKGQKGDAGEGSGDMLQSDYDSASTVKGAGGIVAYVSGFFQTLANKVTSWSASVSDTKYPSEKLVKDSLDLKQDSLPQVTNDRFLHTNSSTGALEWSQVDLTSKQDTLVSGTNIKTINNTSILGSGDLEIAGNQVAVQSAQPTDSDTVLWINPDGQGSSIDSVPTSGSLNAVQSGGVYTALQGKSSNVMASNRNLLDNGWFTVNQRGQSSYTGAVYTVDRWYSDPHINININNDKTITIANTTTGGYILLQKFENNLESGKTYTFSIIYKGEGGILRTRGTVVGLECEPSQDFVIKSLTFTSNGGETGIEFRQSNNSNSTIKAVKLELGSVSTLANDTAPNYAEELAKCQRYFVRIGGGSEVYPIYGIGIAEASTVFYPIIHLSTPLRGKPSITTNGVLKAYNGSSSNLTITSIEIASSNTIYPYSNIVLSANVSGLTQYQTYALANRNSTGYIDLSADL